MKKILFIAIFLCATNFIFAQNYFNTTTSSLNSLKGLTHLGPITIGKQHVNYAPNPWLSYEDKLLELNNLGKNVKLSILNNYGKLDLAVANVDGAYSPMTKTGDVIIRRLGTGKNMIFNLSSYSTPDYSFIFGDDNNNTFLKILGNGKVGVGTSNPQETLHVNGSIRGNIGSGALRIKSGSGYIDVGARSSAYAHIYTDRPKFIFNKDIYTMGAFSSYSGDLILKPAGIEKVRIKKSTGYVGIGTSSPKSKLDLGSNYSNPNSYPNKITLWSGGANNYFGFGISAGTLDYFSQGNHRFFTQYNGTPGTEKMVIKTDGKVGIGTTTPKAVLDVGKFIPNEALGTVFGRLSEGNTSGDGTYLGVKGYGTQGGRFGGKSFSIVHNFYGNTNNSINFFRGASTTGGFLTFNTGANIERMRVDNNGNIGIGTINPDEKLTVKGSIHAEEVRVDLSVPPDFVFQKYYNGSSNLKEDYTMLTLEEVEKFTKKNHHLPEIPSAKQIKEEGLHLKQMTALLLQKVEELTLYTIEQNKRIKVLETTLTEIKK